WREGLVEAIDVEGNVDRVCSGASQSDRFRQKRCHATGRYVTRREDGHALLASPTRMPRRLDEAGDTDLDEIRRANDPLFEDGANRRSVVWTVLPGLKVHVRVELDQAQSLVTTSALECPYEGKRERMLDADGNWEEIPVHGKECASRLLDRVMRRLNVEE